jgi:hypothetical protein
MRTRQRTAIDYVMDGVKAMLLAWVLVVLYTHNVEAPGILFWWFVDRGCHCIY